MNRKLASLVAALIIMALTAVILVIAYSGQSNAADPNKDYSTVSRPTSQVLSSSSIAKPPTDQNMQTESAATAPAVDAMAANSSPSGVANSHPSAKAISQSSTNSQAKGTVKKSGGMVQGLVDVISNMQL